jgi:hypothetical protein
MLLIALALAGVEPPPPAPMSVEVVRDPITDRISASANLYDAGQKLTVTCDASDYGGIRVVFSSNRWLARDSFFTGERPLVYRFDNQRPRRLIWVMRDRGARLAGRQRVGAFLGWLIRSERLVFRTRDVEDHRYDLSFRINGAYPAIARLLDVCGETEMKARLFGAAETPPV